VEAVEAKVREPVSALVEEALDAEPARRGNGAAASSAPLAEQLDGLNVY
jgi:hypothetical protein